VECSKVETDGARPIIFSQLGAISKIFEKIQFFHHDKPQCTMGEITVFALN
jgi:hypothetical protein